MQGARPTIRSCSPRTQKTFWSRVLCFPLQNITSSRASCACEMAYVHAGGEANLQELLSQNSDLLVGLFAAEQAGGPGGGVSGGSEARNAPGPPELAEPSPLLRWTSDGSMMEELLKSIAYVALHRPNNLQGLEESWRMKRESEEAKRDTALLFSRAFCWT